MITMQLLFFNSGKQEVPSLEGAVKADTGSGGSVGGGGGGHLEIPFGDATPDPGSEKVRQNLSLNEQTGAPSESLG